MAFFNGGKFFYMYVILVCYGLLVLKTCFVSFVKMLQTELQQSWWL